MKEDPKNDAIDPLTARLGALARHADTSEVLLERSVELLRIETRARKVALYLCDVSSVAVTDPGTTGDKFASEAVLYCTAGDSPIPIPDRVEFVNTSEGLFSAISEAVSEQISESDVQRLTIIPFFQGNDVRGALLMLDSKMRSAAKLEKIADAFGEFCVMLELVTDRYLQRDLVALNAKYLGIFSDHPQHCMCKILESAADMIGCEGISFFAVDPFDENSCYKLVGTFPRELPSEPPAYCKSDRTLTSKIIHSGRDCVVHYTSHARNGMKNFGKPKWRDVSEKVPSNTVLYVRVFQDNKVAGLLRCTNRASGGQSSWFNWIDVRRAKAIASALIPFYLAAQKEDRFACSLSDISHEIKTMTGAIAYTSNNVAKQILRAGAHNILEDALQKLQNIERSASTLRKLLPALRLESAQDPTDDGIIYRQKAFRPYADLVKPSAESLTEMIGNKNITFRHVGSDQLGLIHADVRDFRHIIDNLLSNAAKYTFPDSEIVIAYERAPTNGSFAAIHVGSHSLPIRPEENEFIFKYRHRAESAKASGIEGEGLGLAIARGKARRYKGELTFRAVRGLNIFSLLIPRGLFQPPSP